MYFLNGRNIRAKESDPIENNHEEVYTAVGMSFRQVRGHEVSHTCGDGLRYGMNCSSKKDRRQGAWMEVRQLTWLQSWSFHCLHEIGSRVIS